MDNDVRKIVINGDDAREKLYNGAKIMHDAVSSTLGPRSANVVLERPFGAPAVIHDGVGIAKEIVPLVDPAENQGAELILQAAESTGAVGDGTTTATILAYQIAAIALKEEQRGGQAMQIRESIEQTARNLADKIRENAIPADSDTLKKIAHISAQVPEVAELSISAYEQVGNDGVIVVDESNSYESSVEVRTGLQISKGFVTKWFANQNGSCLIEDAKVIVTNHSLTSVQQDLIKLFDVLTTTQTKNIVIFASEFGEELIGNILINVNSGNIKALCVQAPDFGDKRDEILRDIAVVTGAKMLDTKAGMVWTDIDESYIGTARSVESTADNTVITGGGGTQADIDDRAAEIKSLSELADTTEIAKEKLLERHAKLTTGIAVINIGARSESEVKELKERAIDAVAAIKAAASGGIVAGGGVTMLSAANSLDDSTIGNRIMKQVLVKPFETLMANSGIDPSVAMHRISTLPVTVGIDVTTNEAVDMLEAGIVDPADVTINAILNATSAAMMIFTSKTLVLYERQKNKTVS